MSKKLLPKDPHRLQIARQIDVVQGESAPRVVVLVRVCLRRKCKLAPVVVIVLVVLVVLLVMSMALELEEVHSVERTYSLVTSVLFIHL